MHLRERLEASREFIAQRIRIAPVAAVTLGSGLGFLVDQLTDAVTLPFGEIPHFPTSSVPGHQGALIAGRFGETPVIFLAGRVHLYEGYSPEEVTYATRVMARLGVTTMVLTNAAGGVWDSWQPGDVMLLSDHLNFQGVNVLCGPQADAVGERFIDMTGAYDEGLRAQLVEWAAGRSLPLRVGVYAGLLGPSYETPAEVRMYRELGADAVGMSTVQEAIAARQAGVRVVGISAITNLAAGVSPTPLTHDEVKENALKYRDRFAEVIRALLAFL